MDATERFILIDGFKRLRSLRRLHKDTLEAICLDMSEPDALLFTRAIGMSHGECALEQGWLLQVFQERFGWSLADVGERFDRSESWVSRRLALVQELPADIQDRVRDGAICPHAAMKYLVPLARANPEDCSRLATAAAKHKLSTRQVGAIYAAWRNSRGKTRARILDDPMLFLRSQAEQLAKNRPETITIGDVLRDVAILAATARRLMRWLSEAGRSAEGAGAGELDQVYHSASMSIVALEQLQAASGWKETANDAS
jgi:ParB-like chromosome segregation protein Spo0J